MNTTDAFEQGRGARKRNVPYDRNPYTTSTTMWSWWRSGWRAEDQRQWRKHNPTAPIDAYDPPRTRKRKLTPRG